MRPPAVLAPLALVLATLAAGCIAPPEADAATRNAAPPPADRVDGMTATEAKEDRKVDCGGSPGVCYERDLLVAGRIGLDALAVDLDGTNGPITVTAGEGDAWSLRAVVRVRGASEEEAREGLDEAWSWSHEEGGKHALKAGPAPSGPVPLPLPLLGGGGAVVVGTRYEVVLPAWVDLDLSVDSSNGPITVTRVRARSLEAGTSNGAVVLRADVRDVSADTSNGPIEATLRPIASGRLSFGTSNGPVRLALVEDAAHGYALEADTSNGRIDIRLADGTLKEERSSATFRTHGYESRRIRSEVAIDTSNGPILVTG